MLGVIETFVYSPFSHMTRLLAREYFIELSRCESLKLYANNIVPLCTGGIMFKLAITNVAPMRLFEVLPDVFNLYLPQVLQ
jgi:hypothetical protein